MKHHKFILSTVIILASLLNVYGSTHPTHNTEHCYSNTNTINLQLKKASLIQVFNLIEKQTDLKFIYISNALYQDTKIDLNVNNQPLESVLKTLKQKSSIDFKITDNGILVKPITQTVAEVNQDKITIKGVVYDETNTPVLGANIYATAYNIGAVTDYDGQFSITIPADTKALKITYIGYEDVDYPLNGQLEIVVNLKPHFAALNEVVITGQGASVQRKRLSSNVEVLKSEDLAGLPSQRIDQLIATKLPNTQINFTGGQSGATTLIRSRGINSAFLSSTPVFYIDGVRMDNLNTTSALGGGSAQGAAMSSIADIPMDNIERIEYINGGAATTLYGSDAANGVIQIFTKKEAQEEHKLQLQRKWAS